jgi:hypothetical protein
VAGGLFSTLLGDTVALDQAIFNGQELWLGVKVGTDNEATPRQQLLPVAYALSLVPGAAIQADSSSAALQLANVGGGEALHASGPTVLDGDLTISGSLSGGSHGHSGNDITSGTVGEAYVDAALARDSEIMPTVLANDGAASGLDADLLDGSDASAFAGATHAHSGGDITSGTVAEARIDAALARDLEVESAVSTHAGDVDAHHSRYTDDEAWAAVLARDGSDSGLDADMVDGYQVTILFKLDKDETVTGRPAFNGGTSGVSPPFAVDSNYRIANLNADLLDGYHSSSFATTSHLHDGRYYTQSTSDSRYVNVTGDTMSGVLTVPQIAYSSPRTHYYSIGSEAFQPRNDVAYGNGSGCGGAYIASGSGALVASVNLPHGAVVTEFTVFFNETSSASMSVSLQRQYLTSCGWAADMAAVTSSGASQYYSVTDTSIVGATIDNTLYGYSVHAFSSAWESTLTIKGAVITYTISEAP